MLEKIKIYSIDVDKMDDDFNCLTCTDEEFIAESVRQKIEAIDIKKFERMLNINVFDHENIVIRFI
ncbi:MAG: hypothetical protein ACR2IM_01250 [Sediminibacterium sp.]